MLALIEIVNAKHVATVDRSQLRCLVTRDCQNTNGTFSFLPFYITKCAADIFVSMEARVDQTVLRT